MGYPVFYSDEASKKLLNTDPKVKAAILNLFGEQAYQHNELNRDFLANQVFNDPDLLKKLNAIAHPAVRLAFEKWASEQTSPFVFNEAAILFETGIYKNYDATVLVTAPMEIRINRVIQRDGSNRETIQKRIEKQWTDEEKRKLADYEIVNDDESLLIPQVLNLIKKISL